LALLIFFAILDSFRLLNKISAKLFGSRSQITSRFIGEEGGVQKFVTVQIQFFLFVENFVTRGEGGDLRDVICERPLECK